MQLSCLFVSKGFGIKMSSGWCALAKTTLKDTCALFYNRRKLEEFRCYFLASSLEIFMRAPTVHCKQTHNDKFFLILRVMAVNQA